MVGLVFRLGQHRFGLPLADIVEVVPAVAVTPFPGAPDVVEGVIDVRGQVVPVLDIRARFRIPPNPLEPSDHFVLARVGGRRFALRANEALDLVRIPEEAITPSVSVVPETDLIAGVARLADGLVLIHDLRKFLTEEESLRIDCALGVARA